MAKRGKGDQPEVTEGEEVDQQNGGVMIKASVLKKLLSYDDRQKGEIDGLTGELREAIGNAVEKNHLDKDAYALAKKFRRMRLRKGPEYASARYTTFLAYLEMSGELKLLNDVMDLPLDAAKNQAPEQTGDDTGGKVARPEFGGRAASAPAH